MKILARCFTSILLRVGKALIVAIRLNKILQSEVYSLIEAVAITVTCTSASRENKKLLHHFFFIIFKLLIKSIQKKSTKGATCNNPLHGIRQIYTTRDRLFSFPNTLIPSKLFLYSL